MHHLTWRSQGTFTNVPWLRMENGVVQNDKKNTEVRKGGNGTIPFLVALEMKYVLHPSGGTETWNKSQYFGDCFGDTPT